MRERYVTRTVTAVTAKVVILNTETLESTIHDLQLFNVTDTKEMLKEAKKYYADILPTSEIVVAIKDFEAKEKRYGMTEKDFILNSIEMELLQ